MLLAGIVIAVAMGGEDGAWAIPVGICATILGGVLWGLSGDGKGPHALQVRRGNTDQAVAQARADGRLALARIDAVKDTGVKVEGDALTELELTVQPTTRAAFRTRARTLVSPARAAYFVLGQRHVVALLSDDGPELVMTEDSPESLAWARRPVPSAETAGPFLKPRRGKVAVDGSVVLSRGGGAGVATALRAVRLVLSLAVLVAAAGAVAYPYREPLAQSFESLKQGRLHPDLRQPANLGPALSKLSKEVGHQVVSDVFVSEDRISIEAPLRVGHKASDDWAFSNGVVKHRGASTIQPDSVEEAFKITDVAWDKMWPAIERAAQQSGLPLESANLSARRNTTFSITTQGHTVEGGGPVNLSIHLSDDYSRATFTVNANGTGLRRIDSDG